VVTHRTFATVLLGSGILFVCAACGVDSPEPGEAGLLVSPTGLKYHDEKFGTGEEALPGDTVSVHYVGKLSNGTKFDSSRDRRQPLVFEIGGHRVIKGWEEGIAGMKVGGKRKLVIPPDLAYGDAGYGTLIPPKAELTFDVELLKVVHPKDLPGYKPRNVSGNSTKEQPNEAPKAKDADK
jgi:hypothetical protein